MAAKKSEPNTFGNVRENKDVRKLTLYSHERLFNRSVDAAIVSCFIHLTDLNVHKVKDMAILKAKPEAHHFTIDDYAIVLERESSLREHSTLVGGAVAILRFLYASEMIDYEWYP